VSVRHVGTLNLAGIIPGFGQALSSLDAVVSSLNAFKTDKSALISRTTTQLSPLLNAATDMQNLLNEGTALLALADTVINTAVGLAGQIRASLSAAGIDLYVFEGNTGNLGEELSGVVPGGNGYALILVAQDGGTWAAIQAVLRT
jgi:hypothetical protein